MQKPSALFSMTDTSIQTGLGFLESGKAFFLRLLRKDYTETLPAELRSSDIIRDFSRMLATWWITLKAG